MSILSKLMDTMRFSPDEDEEYFGPDDDYEAEKPAKRGRFPAREESESYDDGSEEKPRFFSRSSKVVPMKRSMEVSMVKPTSIEDAREICDYLLAGKAVVLNMKEFTQRSHSVSLISFQERLLRSAEICRRFLITSSL